MTDEDILREIKNKAVALNKLLITADLLGLSITITMANISLKSQTSNALEIIQVYGSRQYHIN